MIAQKRLEKRMSSLYANLSEIQMGLNNSFASLNLKSNKYCAFRIFYAIYFMQD